MNTEEQAEHARLREINGGYCPVGLHLVVRDLNVFPKRMWATDVQVWHCETCATRCRRTFTPGGGWSRWERDGN